MALTAEKDLQKAIEKALRERKKKEFKPTKTGGLLRIAGNIFNAPAYTWLGDKIDQYVRNKEMEKEKQEAAQKAAQQKNEEKKEGPKKEGPAAGDRLQVTILKLLQSIQGDVDFIKERLSPKFFNAKSSETGELKRVMYDPLGPAGQQFRRAEEGGKFTSAMGKDLEQSAIGKVTAGVLKQFEGKFQKIESNQEKVALAAGVDLSDPTSFVDPGEDTDPIARLRKEMNARFDEVIDMINKLSGKTEKGSGGDSWIDDIIGGALGAKLAGWITKLFRFGVAGMGVGLAGIIGYAIGDYLNDKFNLSQGIGDILDNLTGKKFDPNVDQKTSEQILTEQAARTGVGGLKDVGLEAVGGGKYKDLKTGQILDSSQLSDTQKMAADMTAAGLDKSEDDLRKEAEQIAESGNKQGILIVGTKDNGEPIPLAPPDVYLGGGLGVGKQQWDKDKKKAVDRYVAEKLASNEQAKAAIRKKYNAGVPPPPPPQTPPPPQPDYEAERKEMLAKMTIDEQWQHANEKEKYQNQYDAGELTYETPGFINLVRKYGLKLRSQTPPPPPGTPPPSPLTGADLPPFGMGGQTEGTRSPDSNYGGGPSGRGGRRGRRQEGDFEKYPGKSDMLLDIPPEGAALLDAIAQPESRGRYDVIVGEGSGQGLTKADLEVNKTRGLIDGKPPATFDDYSDHPRIRGMRTPRGPSTAAGKYQITETEWDRLKKVYPEAGLDDFSPANQDKAAWLLAQERYNTGGKSLYDDLKAGKLDQIGPALKGTWTSLPGGVEEQESTKDAQKRFEQNYRSALKESGGQMMASKPSTNLPATDTSPPQYQTGGTGRELFALQPINNTTVVNRSTTDGSRDASIMGGVRDPEPVTGFTNRIDSQPPVGYA